MAASFLPVLFYALLLVAAVLLPFVARGRSLLPGTGADNRLFAILLASGSIILTIMRHGLLVEGAVLLVLSALGLGLRALAGAIAATLLFATATWWLAELDIQAWQYPLAAATCLGAALIARKCRFEPAGGGAAPSARNEAILVAALFLIGLAAGLLTGATNSYKAGMMAWHHWGAFVSPAYPLLAGGVPFRDFPVQYGMGPTLLIAAACGSNCWTGLYWLTVVGNALYLAVCGWSALLLTRAMGRGARLFALAALTFAMLVWAGYPCDWGGAIMTPSVGGLRFLPLALLAALILFIELGNPARALEAALPRGLALAGHALWLLGLAWSPEAGFFATLIWWPWLALRRADAADTFGGAWLALARGGAIGAAAVIAGYAALGLLSRAVYGDWVSPGEFLLYLRFPPGRLPFNLYGPMWFILAAMLLGALAIRNSQAGAKRRALCVCLLTAVATSSYFVSRSFDNNVFNLLPSLVLLLLATQAAAPTALGGGFLRASLAAMIGLSSAMHFLPWTLARDTPGLAGLQLGPAALVSRLALHGGDPAPLAPREAVRLYTDLRRETGEAVLLFDGKLMMPTADPAPAWTGVNNPANFVPLPPEVIRHYVQRGAQQFRRPGWLIVANSGSARWLSLFDAGYAPGDIRRLGNYTAYRLVPRDAR